MYSVVLAAVLTGNAMVPDLGHRCRRGGCRTSGGYSECYGGFGYGGGADGFGGSFLPGTGPLPAPGGADSGPPPSGGSVDSGGKEAKQALKDLKEEIENLKKTAEKHRLESLKKTIAELKAEQTNQKLEDLKRSIERLRTEQGEQPRLLPGPLPKSLPHLPTPRPLPKLPTPRQGMVKLEMPAGAALFVNDRQVELAPSFLTPELKAGEVGEYDFRVEVPRGGKVVTRTSRVTLRAGSVVRLAYEDMAFAGEREKGSAENVAASTRITVRLPADARLYVHGKFCPLTSSSRSFVTAKLEPGTKYFYTLRAELVRDGRKLSESRQVTFKAGERVTVHFNNLGTTQTSRR